MCVCVRVRVRARAYMCVCNHAPVHVDMMYSGRCILTLPTKLTGAICQKSNQLVNSDMKSGIMQSLDIVLKCIQAVLLYNVRVEGGSSKVEYKW